MKQKQKQRHTAQQPFHHPGIISRQLAAIVLAAGVLLAGSGCSTVAVKPATETAAVPEIASTSETPAQSEAQAGSSFRDCPDCPEMVVIPSGSFMMGSPADEPERDDEEAPQHRVNIPRFALGKHAVTKKQFTAFTRATGYRTEAEKGDGCYVWENSTWAKIPTANWRTPGISQSDSHPAVCITWNDANAYTNWVSRKTGKDYRLPSEAEWEYAARAGTTTPFHTGNTITTSQANFNGNYTYNGSSKGTYRKTTTPVGSFAPNVFGLHDMHGNVWEWVADCYHDNYNNAPANGSVWTDSCKLFNNKKTRVLRGGSWYNGPQILRSASRGKGDPFIRIEDIGFRIARAY